MPLAINPAPTIPTRIGLPAAARASRARSTMIKMFLQVADSECATSYILRQAGRSRCDAAWKQRPIPVFVRHHGDGNRPLDLEGRIVEAQPSLTTGRVGLADLVGDLSAVGQSQVTVSEHVRHIERLAVFLGEL